MKRVKKNKPQNIRDMVLGIMGATMLGEALYARVSSELTDLGRDFSSLALMGASVCLGQAAFSGSGKRLSDTLIGIGLGLVAISIRMPNGNAQNFYAGFGFSVGFIGILLHDVKKLNSITENRIERIFAPKTIGG